MQATRFLLTLLLGSALQLSANTQRAEIHINAGMEVQHRGTTNYALWGTPADYEAEVVRTLRDMLQAKGVERVNSGADFVITVDRMLIRESSRVKKLEDPNRPGVTARTHVAQISVRLSGTVLHKPSGKQKRWTRTVQRSEQVNFREGNRPGRPSRLEKKRMAPNVCSRLSRKTARKAARRIARKMGRMD